MRKFNSLFAVLAISGAAVSAQAQITMTTSNRFSSGYGVTVNYNGANITTSYAGPFKTAVNGPGIAFSNFDTYCVDLGHGLIGTETITPKDIKTALPTSGAQVAYLYDTFAGSVGDSALKGAALQIALWEVEYDYGSSNVKHGIDLNSGTFQFTSASNTALGANYNNIVGLLTNANQTGYLDNLPSNFAGTAMYLDAAHPTLTTGQSLIGPASVPEPGVVSLMASSLIGISAFAVRRRRK